MNATWKNRHSRRRATLSMAPRPAAGLAGAGRQRSGKAAFTLIELLVVIAIIAILAALLLPALQYAKDLAQDTYCMNNLRQLSVSVLSYTDDYNGRVPPHWNRGTDGVLRQQTKAPSNRWIIITTNGKMRAGLTYPDYADSPHVWYCPTHTTTNYTRRHQDPDGTGYGLKHYPNTGWNGQYYSSYAFPAVVDYHTKSNYGGD